MSQISALTPQNNTTRNADSRESTSTILGESQPNTVRRIKFVYDIQHKDKVKLLNILNEAGKTNENLWKELAIKLKIGDDQIESIALNTCGNSSPFEDILCILGDRSSSIVSLIAALYTLKQTEAVNSIKYLLTEEEFQKLLSKLKLAKSANVEKSTNNDNNFSPDLSELLSKFSKTDLNELPIVLNGFSNTNSGSSDNASDTSIRSELIMSELKFGIPEVPYEDLTKATNNWDEKQTLGRGGFGTVFKGVWKHTNVAIKRIEPRDRTTSNDDYKTELKQSMNELRHLNACRHDNILGLYGYSLSGKHPCLVYELMENRTLEYHLFKSAVTLHWAQKYHIAVGTARGLQFLHTFKDKPLIHGDIKPANILLNNCFAPKIGDFGLARESPSHQSIEISKAYGTRPYLPPEFIQTRRLSTKIDTYSFGIVLYEMATRKRVYQTNREPKCIIEFMNHYFEEKIPCELVIDRAHHISEAELLVFIKLTLMGRKCTSFKPDDRPEMVDVLKQMVYSDQQQPS